MSNNALNWAWSLPLSPPQKLVLLCLADHADTQGRCWPSLDRIEEMTCLGRSTVPAALSQLEAQGLITRSRSQGGPKRTTQYQLDLQRTELSERETVKQSTAETVYQLDGLPERPEQSTTESKTVQERDRNHKEPSKTPQRARKHQGEHTLFALWYEHYPLKKSRAQASRAFSKINPPEELVETMINAIEQQERERQEKLRAGEFVPHWKHPATWLNAECWLDEPNQGSSEDQTARKYGRGGI